MALSYFSSNLTDVSSGGETTPAASTDPFAARVEELLRTIETSPTPTFRKASVGQRILGALSDALLNYANVQSGGAAQEGPFARGQREAALRFQTESAAAAESNRDLRNKIRIMGTEERLRFGREKEIAEVRKGETEAEGRRIRLGEDRLTEQERHNRAMEEAALANQNRLKGRDRSRVVYDMKTGQAYSEDLDTHEVRPIMLPSGRPAGKQPSDSASKNAQTALGMRVLSKDALDSYTKYVRDAPWLQRASTSGGRNLPLIGRAAEEFVLSYTDPKGVDVARKIDNIADTLLRLRSGAQINEKEYDRLRRLLPSLGENPKTALANFQRFDTELLTTLRVAYERNPTLFSPELLADLGLSQEDVAGPPQDGSTVDDILRAYEEEFGAEPAP